MKDNGRIGIVGACGFTRESFLPILKEHPAVEVAAICSPSGVSAEKLAEIYEIPSSYQSHEELIDNEEVDGICIITPNDSHHEIALYAMERGIHVICEKPLAIDAEAARLMVEKAVD